MATANAIRTQIEEALSARIPSALTPPARIVRETIPVGIGALDELLGGGFPVGAVTELVGDECSGRTSVVLSLLSGITGAGKVCAWIDASNTFNPSSAATAGVDLKRLLWVRCAVEKRTVMRESQPASLPAACFSPKAITKGLHGGGHGTHPRTEVKGLSAAVDRFLGNVETGSVAEEAAPKQSQVPGISGSASVATSPMQRVPRRARAYDVIEQALRSTDLLIQTGGFGVIVLDLGSLKPEYAARIELSTWHRYRVAAEQTHSSIVLLSQYPCAKSSSELQLRLLAMEDTQEERTVFAGLNTHVEVMRQRFDDASSNVVPMRKRSQRMREACWCQRTSWVGPR